MKIQILGTGCSKCDKLCQHAQQAIDECGVDVELEKVTDMAQIMAFGVMTTPAMVINGEVKVAGKVPTVEAIREMIQ